MQWYRYTADEYYLVKKFGGAEPKATPAPQQPPR